MLHMQRFMRFAALTYFAGWSTSQLLTAPDNSWILWLMSVVRYIDTCECNSAHAHFMHPAALTYLSVKTTSQLLTVSDQSSNIWLMLAVWYINTCECNAAHTALHAPCSINIPYLLVELYCSSCLPYIKAGSFDCSTIYQYALMQCSTSSASCTLLH